MPHQTVSRKQSSAISGEEYLTVTTGNFFLLSHASRSFGRKAKTQFSRSLVLADCVDKEAHIVRDLENRRLQKEQHRQLMDLVRSPKETSVDIPFDDLPFRPAVTFHAREGILLQLSDSLRPGQRPEGLLQAALWGLGGAGKTQIALAYAHRHLNEYDAVFWISAETELKLMESFTAQAYSRGLAAKDTIPQHDHLREGFKRWLITASRRGRDSNYFPSSIID